MTENKQYNPETVKWMCVLAYILFFMPLIVVPNSEDGKFHAVPMKDLPVLLPELDDYRPTDDGMPPLARATDWVNTTEST